MSNDNTNPAFGSMDIRGGKDSNLESVQYDSLAFHENRLLLLSCVADGMIVKAVRAILGGASGTKGSITASGGKCSRPEPKDPYGYYDHKPRNPGNLYPYQQGYHTYVHKLDYGMAHAMFITREPGFLPVVTQDSLWRELNDTRFTTPMLREWLPYIEEKLRDSNLLQDAWCFNARCGILTCNTDDLDSIVTKGLQSGMITIPRKAAS